MRKFASIQEEVMFGLSEHALGKQMLFCPDLYGMGKEPADIAWVANQCAVVMYMKESGKSYQHKRDHNLKQMWRWMKKWKAGERLNGSAVSFSFDDIDHVFGLSFVDGGEVYCQYHADAVRRLADHKLSACATITGNILRQLAHMGASPRDLVFWVNEIRKDGREVATEEAVLNAIRERATAEITVQQAKFGGVMLTSDRYYHHAFKETLLVARWLRDASPNADTASIGADIRFGDLNWLAHAYSALEAWIAPKGKFGITNVAVKRESGQYTFQCQVAAHSGILSETVNQTLHQGPGITILASLDFGREAPVKMLSIGPRNGPSHLETELSTLRSASLSN
jgi:predicted nucleic acid-binding Zn ribbon protein